MSISVKCKMDPYLTQVTPLLTTYMNVMDEITNQKLIIERKFLPGTKVTICLVQIISFPVVVIDPPVDANFSRSHDLIGSQRQSKTTLNEALFFLEIVSIYNEKLQKVLFHIISTERDLKPPGQLNRKLNKLVDLKKEVEDFSQIIDRIIHYYSNKSVGFFELEQNLPTLEELKAQKEKVCQIKKHLKLKELHKCFVGTENDFKISETMLLCALLGISGEYGEWLDSLEPDLRMHQNELYYLVKNMEIEEQKLENVGKLQSGLRKSLTQIGFTEERAAFIVNNVPEHLIDVQWPAYWAERYLEHIFFNHPLLNDVPRYPYLSEVNVWFQREISSANREEPDNDNQSFSINMINIDTSQSPYSNNLVADFLKTASKEDPESVLLYHGTSHVYAESILTDGIILSKGKSGQDFSSGDGFYLSEKFENAKMWSKTPRGEHHAVVVFKVKKDLIDADKANGIDVTQDRKKWEEIVKLCRNKYTGNKAARKLVKDVSFIRGFMCQNPKEVSEGKPAKESGDVQMCVRDDEYSVEFGSLRNILSVIFY